MEELYLVEVKSINFSKLLVCIGKERVIKKIEDLIWDKEREFIYWNDLLDSDEENINNLHLFKHKYCTYKQYTFSILASETI